MALISESIKSSIAQLGFLSPLNVLSIPSKNNLTRVARILQEYACRTCTFMQEKDHLSCSCRNLARILHLYLCKISARSFCKNLASISVQDFCKILLDFCRILQDVREKNLFLQGYTSLARFSYKIVSTGNN